MIETTAPGGKLYEAQQMVLCVYCMNHCVSCGWWGHIACGMRLRHFRTPSPVIAEHTKVLTRTHACTLPLHMMLFRVRVHVKLLLSTFRLFKEWLNGRHSQLPQQREQRTMVTATATMTATPTMMATAMMQRLHDD